MVREVCASERVLSGARGWSLEIRQEELQAVERLCRGKRI
jgi:hypothetical protein